jgi:hypothetical protein
MTTVPEFVVEAMQYEDKEYYFDTADNEIY